LGHAEKLLIKRVDRKQRLTSIVPSLLATGAAVAWDGCLRRTRQSLAGKPLVVRLAGIGAELTLSLRATFGSL
jgi:hypothetical protein